MMFEVEAKVHITKIQYQALRKRLKKEAKYLGARRNEDTYYAKHVEQGTVRMRKRGTAYTFDLKVRKTVNGIESNIEMEWPLKHPEGWRKLLTRLGIKPYIRKTKKTEAYGMDGFVIELNEIRLLGKYLEIEKIVKDQKEIKKTKSDLIQLFRKLGFKPSQFEPKRYLELLANV